MYIIERIIQYIKGKKYKPKMYSPDVAEDIIEDPQKCEHLFLPLDSTNELFGCKYCGEIVSRDKLKDKNIFRQKLEFKLKNPEK